MKRKPIAKQARNLVARQREEVQAWRAYIEKRTGASKGESEEKKLEAKAKQKERFRIEDEFEKLLKALVDQIPSPKDRHLLTQKQRDFLSVYTSRYVQLSQQVNEGAWNELVKKINSMQDAEKEQKLALLTAFAGRLEEIAAAIESMATVLEL